MLDAVTAVHELEAGLGERQRQIEIESFEDDPVARGERALVEIGRGHLEAHAPQRFAREAWPARHVERAPARQRAHHFKHGFERAGAAALREIDLAQQLAALRHPASPSSSSKL